MTHTRKYKTLSKASITVIANVSTSYGSVDATIKTEEDVELPDDDDDVVILPSPPR